MDLSWVSLKLDSEMSPSLLPPVSECSVIASGYGPWDSAKRELACWLSDGMVIGVDGGISIPGSKPSSRKGMGWNVCGNGVKTWPTIIIHLICYYIGNPSLIGSFWIYPTCIQFPQSNAHRVGVASTNRTDKFWHIGSAEEYSSEEFDGWGVRSYAQVWRSYHQAVLNECYLWFRQCGDVIIYVIPHYLYSDITMYGCDIRLEFG